MELNVGQRLALAIDMHLILDAGAGTGKKATSEIRYLGEANLIEGHSFGEDIETFRHRFEIIGDAEITGSGATGRVVRGVSVVFF